jgi:hypothetical protein
MRIILDTNIVFRDFRFLSPASRTLFSGMVKANHSLYVPKVIFDEIVNKYVENVGELLGKAKRLGFSGLTVDNGVVDDVTQARSSYTEFLTRKFKSIGAKFLEYPATSHEELVNRALRRRKPFRSTDTGGYRDTLIWETIKILACQKPKETIAFISDNPKDFSDDNKKSLHPQLIDELKALGENASDVLLFGSLDEFVSENILPILELIEKVKAELEAETYEQLSLKTVLQEDLPDLIRYMGFSSRDLELPSQFEELVLSSVEEAENIHKISVHKLPTGELLISLTADIKCKFEFFMFKEDYYAMDSRENITLWNEDWNEWYVFGLIERKVQIMFNLVFNEAKSQVVSARIASIKPLE